MLGYCKSMLELSGSLYCYNLLILYNKHNTDLSGLNSMLRITRPKIHCIKAAASQRPRNITPRYPAAYTVVYMLYVSLVLLRHK